MNKSGIDWTDYTWNPTSGCTHVSTGCANCYAEALSIRFGRSKHPWIKPYEHANVRLHPDRLRQPFKIKTPSRCFVDSMSDLFHELIPDEYIAKVFAVMAATPHITYQILTKRPERMRDFVSDPYTELAMHEAADELAGDWEWCHIWGNNDPDVAWPLPNVWLGTSVEDQRAADERIPVLIDTPAVVRFLSCEPLLAPVDLTEYLASAAIIRAIAHHHRTNHPCGGTSDGADCETCGTEWVDDRVDLHWIITGGESGPRHRPFDPAWARRIRDQSLAANVAFLHKQNGGRTPKAGGRLLDGREWNEFPMVAS